MDIDSITEEIRVLISAVSSMTSKLDSFTSQQAEQTALNRSIRQEMDQFALAITKLTEKVSALSSDTQSSTNLPTTFLPPATTNCNPSQVPTTWSTVVRQRRPPISERKRLATARVFAPPRPSDATPGYKYVYIPRARRMDRKDIRQRFQKLGIAPIRILDITFPARSVIGVLIHSDFQEEFLNSLAASKVEPIQGFDPLAHEHVADPQFKDMAIPQRARLASAIQQDRCIRTLEFLRPYLVLGVAKYFVQKNWIPEAMAASIYQARVPRPTKRTKTDPSSATAAFLTETAQTQLFDAFGNPVDHQDVPMDEDFAPNAYGPESSDEEDVPVTTNHRQ